MGLDRVGHGTVALSLVTLASACGPAVILPDAGGSEGSETGTAGQPMANPETGQPATTTSGSMDGGSEFGVDETSTGRDASTGQGTSDTATSSGGQSTGDPDPTTGDASTSTSTASTTDGGSTSTGAGLLLCAMPPPTTPCDAYDPQLDALAAIGLGCDEPGIALVSSSFNSVVDDSWAVVTQFGTATDPVGDPVWGPREGDSFLFISNAAGAVPDDDGVLTVESYIDTNDNPDGGSLPAPIASAVSPNDLLWLQFEVEVPEDVSGFALDAAFFSEEFPEYVGTSFNDALIVWAETGTFSGDLCQTGGLPCTVTGVWPTAFMPGAGELVGTGFENDGATTWFTIRGPADPGGTLQLTIAIFDDGDSGFTTAALLDAFVWECEGCDPDAVPSTCGY